MTSINKNTFKKDVIIGTAQLGEEYGIFNKNKNFNLNDRLDFLNFTYTNGFNSYDTAFAYKNSHEILGKWINSNIVKPEIYTKLPKLENHEYKELSSIFSLSLNQLKVKKIEGLLLHNSKDWLYPETKIFIEHIIKTGKINSFGLSIYDENDIHIDENISILQIPGNIFNQQIFYSDKINNFQKNHGIIHIRSIFIQGLLLMKPESIPQKLDILRKPLANIHRIAHEINIDITTLAFLCIKKLMPTAKVIIGLDDINQAHKLLNINNKLVSEHDLDEVIKFGLKNQNKYWDPRNWK